MDGELFLSWFKRIFLLNCGRERPVILVLDNHDSHITLPLVETARANNIILLGMPAHTTHILQPLDVKVNAPLKRRFSSLATNLGFANPNMTISKGNFPVVLRHALEQTTPSSVREAFRITGIIPFDPHAIDKSQLIPPTFVRRNEENGGTENTNVRTCESCGSYLVNPRVDKGLIPPSMAQVLIPPCNKQKKTNQKKNSRVVAEGRVISGDEIHKQLKGKEESSRKLEEAKEERLKLKEIRKEHKEKDIEERQQKKLKRIEQRELKEKQKEHEKIKKSCWWTSCRYKIYMWSVWGER